MDLYMHLYAVTYLYRPGGASLKGLESYAKLLAELGIGSCRIPSGIPLVNLSLIMVKWTNAYQIHRWLIDRANEGKDLRHAEIPVRPKDLQELGASASVCS